MDESGWIILLMDESASWSLDYIFLQVLQNLFLNFEARQDEELWNRKVEHTLPTQPKLHVMLLSGLKLPWYAMIYRIVIHPGKFFSALL